MSSPTIVLVHGGQHTGTCWDPTVHAIGRIEPATRTLAVDLPGRREEPGDLASLTIQRCVDSVVRQINDAGADEVVLVGHSMAGLTLPGVATALGGDRVRRMIYVACCVPAQGRSIQQTLQPPVRWIAGVLGHLSREPVSRPLPAPIARWMFANGMTPTQKAQMVAGLVPESAALTYEKVDRSAMPDRPTTWVLPLRDRSLRPSLQRRCIENLGNVDEIVELDTCHNAMASGPDRLARIILDRLS